jgi:hypothetical protein
MLNNVIMLSILVDRITMVEKDEDVAAVWQAILNGWQMRSPIFSLRRRVKRLRSLGLINLWSVGHLRRLLNSGQDLGWLKMRSPC